MKRIILKFPPNKAGEVADVIGTHQFVTLLSWAESDGMFSFNIKCHLAIPAEKEDTAIAKFQGYIQKS